MRKRPRRKLPALALGLMCLTMILLLFFRRELLFHSIGNERPWLAVVARTLGAATNYPNDDALMIGIDWCRPGALDLALSLGARPQKIGSGTTAFHVAAIRSHWCDRESAYAARKLLKFGIDVNARSGDHTALMSLGGGRETAAVLLAAGADVQAVDAFDRQIIHNEGGLCVVDVLLRNGANANAVMKSGRTPLHSIAMQSKERWQRHCLPISRVIDLLVQHGADVNAADRDGMTPLDYARKHEHKEAIAALERHGAQGGKFGSAAEAVAAKRAETEYTDLRQFGMAPRSRLAPKCSFNLYAPQGDVMEEGPNWTIPLGTEAKLRVNCTLPGYVHSAMLLDERTIPKRLNMTTGGTHDIVFDREAHVREMLFFFSEEPIKDLMDGIMALKARAVATRHLTVLPAPGRRGTR